MRSKSRKILTNLILINALVWLIMFGCAVGITFFVILQKVPITDSVQKAAKSMTAEPTIVNGRISFIGCSSGDIYVYDVLDSKGEKVGYVCSGLLKGATPRF